MEKNTSRRVNASAALVGLLFNILAYGVLHAQEASPDPEWSPQLSMQFRRIQGTALSPDGSRVAYTLSTPLMEGTQSKFDSQIWIASSDGSRNTQYTRGEYSASAPAFSPDGEYLSFISKRGEGDAEKSQLWIMPLFGGEARQLTAAENDVTSYRWSPDGDRIAFTMQDPLSAERQKEIEEKRDVILVDQQPRYTHLHVASIEPDAAEPASSVQITSGELVVGGFSWSPAGDEIAFAHKPTADLNEASKVGDISVVSVPSTEAIESLSLSSEGAGEQQDEDGSGSESAPPQLIGEVRRLVAGNGVEANPHWSPDGNWIAYTSSGPEPNLIGLNDVFVVAARGGDSRMLTQTPNRSANIRAWSGNSDELFLSEIIGSKQQVIGLPLRGESIRTITSGEGVARNVAIAANGAVMSYSWEHVDSPWDVYIQPTSGTAQPSKLTSLHSAIDVPQMGKTELISWRSEDGLEIEGLLTYPIGYEEGASYPIILNVHGGPSGVFTESFTGGPSIYMTQYFAQQGFAILRPNPRGSTGYGYEFRAATAGDWGQGDLNDLLSGLDLVIERGIGDPDNQFLMGWSYGGYMTSYAVTQTDRFKAASMGAGLSNLLSMSTTTDIRDYLVEHLGDFYWNDIEAYQRSSAINHIKNVVTPTQVIHGQQDLRVPISQGQEFYNSLKYLGVDTEMIVYPRTPHGPREPKFLMDVSARILAWFNKYR